MLVFIIIVLLDEVVLDTEVSNLNKFIV